MPLPMEPEPGHYAVRFAKSGPLVACRIVFDGRLYFLFIGGRLEGTANRDGWKVSPRMETVAFSRKTLTAEEYAVLLAGTEGAQAGDPLTDPAAAVDLRAAPPLYRKRK